MSAPKIAALLGAAGLFGVIVSVMLGKFAGADYLLDAAFVCLGLAAVIMILHVLIGGSGQISPDPPRAVEKIERLVVCAK